MEGSFDEYQSRRSLFGTEVGAYESGRPGYPDRVYDLLRIHCGLGPQCRLLEIGPGTGQATGRLLDSGASVTAVEFSTDMADRLRSKYLGRDLKIQISAFEEVDLESARFDLITAATSFHWVPTDLGLRRCTNLLEGGGWLALWWNYYGDPARPDPFNEALIPILRKLAPALLDVPGTTNTVTGVPDYALDTRARTAELEAIGRFGPVEHEVIAWTGRHEPAELRAMFASFSPWLALPLGQRTLALDALERLAAEDFGGIVERPYLTPIYMASKLDEA